MASLQARHSRSCALGRPWTTFAEATKSQGCTCAPLYHTRLRLLDVIREANKARTRKTPKGAVPASRETSPATLAKHLRQLGACLEAAIAEGYATENPVRRLHKTARPRVQKQRPAYYTDGELA